MRLHKIDSRWCPLEISGYGIKLRRMEPSDLTDYCRWLNDPFVQQSILLRPGKIRFEKCSDWFFSRHPTRDWYFIIEAEGKPIGWTALFRLDYVTFRTGAETVIGEEWARRGDYSFRAVVLLIELAKTLAFPPCSVAINPNNTTSIRFNAAIGMEEVFRQKQFRYYRLRLDKFLAFRSRLTRTWLRATGEIARNDTCSAGEILGTAWLGGTTQRHAQNLRQLKESGILPLLRREKIYQRTIGLIFLAARKLARLLRSLLKRTSRHAK